MNTNNETILVVDDDPNILKALSVRLKLWGYQVMSAFDGAEALTLTEVKKPDLIITDIWMPAGNGFSLAYRLKQTLADIPIIFLSASKQSNLKKMAKDFEAVAYLEKPYEPEALQKAVTTALAEKNKQPQTHLIELNENELEYPGTALAGRAG
ncbi:MAG TPA: response regulator [Verrucomicrobiae bacterium]|nr:response regulator [Verrucomicrobiae bacterium]